MTVPTAKLGDDPASLAAAWLAVEPDPEFRHQLGQLMSGPPAELHSLFSERLGFGTAGLRGELGLGPLRMNRVLVRVVAAALGSVLEGDDRHVVIGFDARHGSRDFASDTARALAAAGVRVTLFDDVVPTPLLAFAVRHLDASAGVMVTASHNPRHDNGYKVYWRGGAQLASPTDQLVSEAIDAQPLLAEADLAPLGDPLINSADESLRSAYVDAVAGLVDRSEVAQRSSPHRATVAYSPLHGVGGATLLQAFERAGFDPPHVVSSQATPDPDFPTAPFPNPEETGVLDDLLQLATGIEADVALVNDPDADRLAVAVPHRSSWRLLTGDELGALLAEHLLASSSSRGAGRLVVNTVVSSRLLRRIADSHGVSYVETLTGFKWIMQAVRQHPELDPVLGYEEALGYSVGSIVSDKDGISAALVVVDLVEQLLEQGRTLLDFLGDIQRRHGVHATGQRALRFESTRFESTGQQESVMVQAMRSLRANPPQSLGGQDVATCVDLADGSEALPATDAVILELDGTRVVVRPSGTEPKMKIYGEVIMAPSQEVEANAVEARVRLTTLLDDAVERVANPDHVAEAAAPLETPTPLLGTDGAPDPQLAVDLRLLVRCLGLALPEGNQTAGALRALCAVARRPDPTDPTVGPVAAVVVHPNLVVLAKELTAGSPIDVAVKGETAEHRTSLAIEFDDVSSVDQALGHLAAVRSEHGEDRLTATGFRVAGPGLLGSILAHLWAAQLAG